MKFHKLLEDVKDILFHEWDPIGVNDNPLCRNEYDSYATTIVRYLREGADEKKSLRIWANCKESAWDCFRLIKPAICTLLVN